MSNLGEHEERWLDDIRRSPSINCDERPFGTKVELIVLHAISLPPNEFGENHIEKFFTNALDCDRHPYFKTLEKVRVSPHFLINREGEITQFVELRKRAWHSGESCWLGRRACNDFSIGIELEGCDTSPFELLQYDSLANIIIKIFEIYPEIQKEAVVGHSDIAPDRKTDPGPFFNWDLLQSKISEFMR